MNKKGTYAKKIGKIFNKMIFVILLIVCVTAITVLSSLVLSSANSTLKGKVTALTGSVNSYMASKTASLSTFAAAIESMDSKSYKDLLSYVNAVTDMDDSTAAVYILYPNETIVYSGGWMPDIGVTLTTNEWYVEACAMDSIYISEPYYVENTKKTCITISKAVRADDGSIKCVAGMDLCVESIQALAAETYHGDYYTFLATGKDTILAHPNMDFQVNDSTSLTLTDADNGRYSKLSGVNSVKTILTDYSGGPKQMLTGFTDCGFKVIAVAPILPTIITILIALFVIIALFVLAVILSNRYCNKTISKWFTPINSISGKVAKMAEGDLTVSFDEEGVTDEIIELTASLNNTIEQLHAYIDDIRHVVSNVAKGNLAVHQHVTYKGDFVAIKTSLIEIINNLNITLSKISENSTSVSDFSSQIQQSTQQVAEGATSQSLAIADLRDNISTLSQKLHEVEESAVLAADLSKTTKSHLAAGDCKMKDLIQAMENINQSSDQIGSIVNTINELADQTNLLSLNASIEAARAGEAGKGFAVVADEISKLANASAAASNNINDLIQASKEVVQRGKDMAAQTADALKSGVDNFLVSENKLLEITNSVKEQTIAITGISDNAEQISTVIETTAAASEETAAISEEMISRSHELMDSVNQFKLV